MSGYQAQSQRPFEHEARVKELLPRQAQLNASLDLDKRPYAETKLSPIRRTGAKVVRLLARGTVRRARWSALR